MTNVAAKSLRVCICSKTPIIKFFPKVYSSCQNIVLVIGTVSCFLVGGGGGGGGRGRGRGGASDGPPPFSKNPV